MKQTKIFNLGETLQGIAVIILILVMSFLCCCSSDNKQNQEATQSPPAEEVIPEKGIIKKIQTVDGARIITTDQKGHDVDVTIYWSGVGCAIDNAHYPQICEKCRAEQGLPPN